MMYKFIYSARAYKQMQKLDKGTQKLIYNWISKNLLNGENPRNRGKALIAARKGEWRYRIGDYRIICDIRDNELIILALSIGHRKNVY